MAIGRDRRLRTRTRRPAPHRAPARRWTAACALAPRCWRRPPCHRHRTARRRGLTGWQNRSCNAIECAPAGPFSASAFTLVCHCHRCCEQALDGPCLSRQEGARARPPAVVNNRHQHLLEYPREPRSQPPHRPLPLASTSRWPSGCARTPWAPWLASSMCWARACRCGWPSSRGAPTAASSLGRRGAGGPPQGARWPEGARAAVERAEAARDGRMQQRTIVFVDEVHRFNKSQQDAFLPHVESGLFTFIGATTENPSFEVNSALLSRATVYVLQPLSAQDLQQIVALAQAQHALPAIEDAAVERLVAYADGDARRL